ncbi:hypothetical protein BU15DRAFT_81625 [Melanogaster broomeanus]|nr:hypothetical protein BU15DRAFT_81625 [Melanogaster broomeanus]
MQLVAEMQKDIGITLITTSDRSLLPTAHFLIMATGAKKPVITVDEISPDAVMRALGINELLTKYFNHLTQEHSTILVDNIEAVEKHGVDALAYYYSHRGKKLTNQGRDNGIMNIMDFLDNPLVLGRKTGGAAHVAPVRLANRYEFLAPYGRNPVWGD